MADVQTDVLVIGSGIAGLMYAIKVAEKGTVALVTKKEAMDSNTNLAQGGIASVFGQDDSFGLHIDDTLASGDGLCHQDVVSRVVKDGPARINELMEMGVRFNLQPSLPETEAFDLGREGGHSQNRIVHAKDMTGQFQGVMRPQTPIGSKRRIMLASTCSKLNSCSARMALSM